MRFSIEGKEYDFVQKFTVEEAILLKEKAGLGIFEFDLALLKGEGPALATLIYLGKRRAGEALRYQDVMQLDLLTFIRFGDDTDGSEPDESEGAKPQEKAGPTKRSGGTSRKRDTTTTS